MITVKKRYEFEPQGFKQDFPPLDYRRRSFNTYRLVNYTTIVST